MIRYLFEPGDHVLATRNIYAGDAGGTECSIAVWDGQSGIVESIARGGPEGYWLHVIWQSDAGEYPHNVYPSQVTRALSVAQPEWLITDVVAHDRYIYASLHYMDYTLRWVWVFIPAGQSIDAILVRLLSDGERELGGMDEKSWQVHEEVEPANFLLEIYAPNSEFRFRPSERSK